MKIGIDISQLAYEGTGVANLLKNLVEQLLLTDTENEYILFYSSLRKGLPNSHVWSQGSLGPVISERVKAKSVTVSQFKFPPTLLEFVWNRLHVFSIEKLIGPVDVFISSDWLQPPTKAKKVTILYDLIVYKFPEETHNQWKFSLKNLLVFPNIVASQKRRMQWVKKEVDKIICISEATKKDAIEIVGLPANKLTVVYPGM